MPSFFDGFLCQNRNSERLNNINELYTTVVCRTFHFFNRSHISSAFSTPVSTPAAQTRTAPSACATPPTATPASAPPSSTTSTTGTTQTPSSRRTRGTTRGSISSAQVKKRVFYSNSDRVSLTVPMHNFSSQVEL